ISKPRPPLGKSNHNLVFPCSEYKPLSEGALTVVENTEGGRGVDEEEEVTVDNDDDDDGVFEVVQPNEQWQTLKPGEAVPAGSHVRLNLQTGEREVRLGEEQLKYWTQQHRWICKRVIVWSLPLTIT
uniref:Uncharacterized protein n=1 Tax=Xiphophorus couchianus TaxID=32473 RepID=A0A3B5M467_9TELE